LHKAYRREHRAARAAAFVVVATTTLFPTLVLVPQARAAPLSFVQVTSATPQTNQSTISVAYPGAQTSGNTNVVAIGWNSSNGTVSSITDTRGNSYQVAAPLTRGANLSQVIYYAKNIAAAPGGGNTITINFSGAVPFADVRALEYSGIAATNPVDVSASASGSTNPANSGAVTTGTANELIFGAGMTTGAFTAAGTGFTSRIITKPDADIAEDRIVSTVGSYGATATLGGSTSWVMQMVGFRGIAQ
jgi:hypothetical protein